MKLTIKNLALRKGQIEVAAVKRFEAQLALHKLIVDKIKLQRFIIDGLFLKIEQINEVLLVAGIELPSADDKTTESTTEAAQANEFPYQIVLPKFSLTDSKVAINIDNNGQSTDHIVMLNELLISDVAATIQQQNVKISLKALIDNAPLNLHADAKLQPR